MLSVGTKATEADEDSCEEELVSWSEQGLLSVRVVAEPVLSGNVYRGCGVWGRLMTVLAMAGFIGMSLRQGGIIQATNSHGWGQFWGDPATYKSQTIEVLKFQGEHACGPQLANIVFQSNISWKDMSGDQSGALCQRACTWNKDCNGFTWHWDGGCDLMQFSHAGATEFATRYKKGTYSGYACHREASNSPFPWISNEEEKHTLPKPEHGHHAPKASMLCLMVVRPYTYEIDLAIMQHKQGIGIFQCKHQVIYSNQLINLAHGLSTRKFNSSQQAEIGGQWMTALNTDIFMALWRAVITDGDYLKTGWTVKVDPDTVWFPHRLRPILLEQEKAKHIESAGAYFQNCWQGMHGPIEVLSQNALRALALHSKECFWAMNSWGDWQWGEDAWVDICLKDTASSRRIYNPQILAEDHCNKWEGWSLTPDACLDQDTVAFHPFKDEWHYKHCFDTAQQRERENSIVPSLTNEMKK